MIIWESTSAIAVDKPAGQLVHNSAFAGPKELSLRQELGALLGRRVYPVHRLDRGTSGVVLFAREAELVAPWQEALSDETAAKLYVAIVRGRLEGRTELEYPVKDADGIAREAASTILGLAVSPIARVSLVGLRLHTGRHHQARRHLAHLRHPIVNDAAHGNSRFNREFRADHPLERMALHCLRIDVDDPFESRRLRLRVDPSAALRSSIYALFPDAESALGRISELTSSSGDGFTLQ